MIKHRKTIDFHPTTPCSQEEGLFVLTEINEVTFIWRTNLSIKNDCIQTKQDGGK